MGIESVSIAVICGVEGLRGPLARYAFLDRLAKCARRRSVHVLAFGFGADEVRLLLEGSPRAVGNSLRGVKVGTTRAVRGRGIHLVWGPSHREEVSEDAVEDAVVTVHRAPMEAGAASPLASPWSSHRDLLHFRTASFFDPSRLCGRVSARRVHERCGGRALPEGWPPPIAQRESLNILLRIAAGVLGVLPADRRCFQLFVHLARFRGWRNPDVADALCLTPRRVRQLFGTQEPRLPLALTALADARLSRVP